MNKLIIFSAPSGSGKTTIVKHLLSLAPLNLAFSISATSRAPRGEEVHGKEYYFLSGTPPSTFTFVYILSTKKNSAKSHKIEKG